MSNDSKSSPETVKGELPHQNQNTCCEQAAAVLQQNADLFSTLIEQAPVGMYVVDSQFRMQQINSAAMPAFQHIHPLIGRDFAELMEIQWGPETGRKCAAIFRHTLQTGERYVSPPFFEQRYDLGVEESYEWETQRVTLPDGRYGVVCWFREITARARIELALRESEQSLREALELAKAANQSKSAFLANMSHEIRTPMTAIMGYTDLVAEQVPPGECSQHLRTIKRNGQFLLEIINDILDLSKIEAGKFELSFERFSPERVIEDVRSIMEIRADEKNIDLSVEYRGRLPSLIESDAKCLKQILINLVGNAIKFTKDGGVKVIVMYTAPTLQLDIVDTGIGMTDEQRQRLFKPFSQGDASVAHEFGGTGLGLAISGRLAESLGGAISVESTLGQGSRFTVTIAAGNLEGVPMSQPNARANIPAVPETRDPTQLSGHVLIVDDRREIRFLSNRFLMQAGATTCEAENGEQAVQIVREAMEQATALDLVLLDMQMPRLDGYETAVQLRQLGYPGPIIALTADAMQGDMVRCFESGCNDYLSKPIDKWKLLETVEHYLRVMPNPHPAD